MPDYIVALKERWGGHVTPNRHLKCSIKSWRKLTLGGNFYRNCVLNQGVSPFKTLNFAKILFAMAIWTLRINLSSHYTTKYLVLQTFLKYEIRYLWNLFAQFHLMTVFNLMIVCCGRQWRNILNGNFFIILLMDCFSS